jgi:glycosyltransferase involved in cell wall biosynthesis
MHVAKQDVSVVVLTKNSARTIQLCLDSVFQERPHEVIVVDALSIDKTLEIVSHHSVRLVEAKFDSLGYSRKLGVDAASSDFVHLENEARTPKERLGWNPCEVA